MKADMPFEDRIRHSFVFGVKHILVERWGWEKRAIWVEPKAGKNAEEGKVWVGKIWQFFFVDRQNLY